MKKCQTVVVYLLQIINKRIQLLVIFYFESNYSELSLLSFVLQIQFERIRKSLSVFVITIIYWI